MNCSEEECIFWLYLKTDRKDQALKLIDKIDRFECFFPFIFDVVGVECLEYVDKFEKFSYPQLGIYSKNECLKKKFVYDFAIYLQRDKNLLTKFYEKVSELNLLTADVVFSTLMIICLNPDQDQGPSFNVELFENYSCHTLNKNEENTKLALYLTFVNKIPRLANYHNCLIEFLRYVVSQGYTIEKFADFIDGYCRGLDLFSEEGYKFFIKLYETIETEFDHRINLSNLLANAPYRYGKSLSCAYESNVKFLDLPIYLFIEKQGFDLSCENIVGYALEDTHRRMIQGFEFVIEDFLFILRRASEFGSYNHNLHFCSILCIFVNIPNGMLNYEILDEIMCLGVDLGKLAGECNIDIRNYPCTTLASYMLEKYPDARTTNMLWFAFMLKDRFEDFDLILHQIPAHDRQYLLENSDDYVLFHYIGERVFDYIAEGFVKPINVYDYLGDRVSNPIELLEKLIGLNIIEENVDSFIHKVFRWVIEKYVITNEYDMDLWSLAFNAIPEKLHHKVVLYCLEMSNTRRYCPIMGKDLLQVCLDLQTSNLAEYTKEASIIISYDFIWGLDPKYDSLWDKVLTEFQISSEDDDNDVAQPEAEILQNQKAETEIMSALKCIRRKYPSDLLFKIKTNKGDIDLVDYFVDIIKRGLVSKSMVPILIAKHAPIESASALLPALKAYAEAGLSFDKIHLDLFNNMPTLDHQWLNNKCICEFVLEQNSLLQK
jgi:hypothetical protein